MREEISVVLADRCDASEIATVHRQTFQQAWSDGDFDQFLSEHVVTSFVVKVNGAIRAFVVARSVEDEAEILTIGVVPEYRRQGYAAKLLEKLVEFLQERRVDKLFLEVAADNDAAIALYKKFGFEEFSRRIGYYRVGDGSGPTDCLNLRLKL